MYRAMIACLALVMLTLPVRAAEPVALVVDASRTKAVEILQELKANDKLKLEDGALVKLVFYLDGHQEHLSGPGTFTVSPSGTSGGTAQRIAAPGPGKLYPKGENIGRGTGGSIRADWYPVAFQLHASPGETPASRRFVASWSTPHDGPYELVIYQEDQQLWTGSTDKTSLEIPMLELDRRYVLELRPPDDTLVVEGPFNFPINRIPTRILSEEVRRQLEDAIQQGEDRPEDHMMLMRLLWEQDQVQEAACFGLKMLELRPDDPGLEQAVQELVMMAGDPDQIAAFYVDRLERSPGRKDLLLKGEQLRKLAEWVRDPLLRRRLHRVAKDPPHDPGAGRERTPGRSAGSRAWRREP
ncbi:MAG: hypothetical protein HY319_23480 [Armatimonadetes bacterium]|nr:hypothetical protein [Armatimonadota bacterium]